MKSIMTKTDVAELIGCKPETIDAYARDKTLPATKLGGSWVFTADTLIPAINRLIESETKAVAKAVQVKSFRPDLRGI